MFDWRYGLTRFSERDADGFVGFQPDYIGGADAGGTTLEGMHPFGFRSRPLAPTLDIAGAPLRGAGLLYVYDGGEAFALPTQDPRYAAILPDEGQGGAMMYATIEVGAWRDVAYALLEGDDGSFTLRVPYAAGAKEHRIEVDVGATEIRITHGDGLELVMTATDIRLGSAISAQAVALAHPLATFLAAVASALTTLGASPGPVPSFAATKVKAE